MKRNILILFITYFVIPVHADEPLLKRKFKVSVSGVSLKAKAERVAPLKKTHLIDFPFAAQGLDVNHDGEFIISSWASKEVPEEGDPALPIRKWEGEKKFTELASLTYDGDAEDNLQMGTLTFYVGDVAQDTDGSIYFSRANFFPGKIYKIDSKNPKKITHIKTGKTVRALETPTFDPNHIYALNPDGITRYRKDNKVSDKGEKYLDIDGKDIQLNSFTFLNNNVLLVSLAMGDSKKDQSWTSSKPLLLLIDLPTNTYRIIARENFGDIDATSKSGTQTFYSMSEEALYKVKIENAQQTNPLPPRSQVSP